MVRNIFESMKNRPRGPCWVVGRKATEADLDDGMTSWLEAPDKVDTVAANPHHWVEHSYVSIQYVRPFTDEVEAIRAALLINGFVERIEDEEWRDVGPSGPAWEGYEPRRP